MPSTTSQRAASPQQGVLDSPSRDQSPYPSSPTNTDSAINPSLNGAGPAQGGVASPVKANNICVNSNESEAQGSTVERTSPAKPAALSAAPVVSAANSAAINRKARANKRDRDEAPAQDPNAKRRKINITSTWKKESNPFGNLLPFNRNLSKSLPPKRHATEVKKKTTVTVGEVPAPTANNGQKPAVASDKKTLPAPKAAPKDNEDKGEIKPESLREILITLTGENGAKVSKVKIEYQAKDTVISKTAKKRTRTEVEHETIDLTQPSNTAKDNDGTKQPDPKRSKPNDYKQLQEPAGAAKPRNGPPAKLFYMPELDNRGPFSITRKVTGAYTPIIEPPITRPSRTTTPLNTTVCAPASKPVRKAAPPLFRPRDSAATAARVRRALRQSSQDKTSSEEDDNTDGDDGSEEIAKKVTSARPTAIKCRVQPKSTRQAKPKPEPKKQDASGSDPTPSTTNTLHETRGTESELTSTSGEHSPDQEHPEPTSDEPRATSLSTTPITRPSTSDSVEATTTARPDIIIDEADDNGDTAAVNGENNDDGDTDSTAEKESRTCYKPLPPGLARLIAKKGIDRNKTGGVLPQDEVRERFAREKRKANTWVIG